LILAHNGRQDAPIYGPARRVNFSELLGGKLMSTQAISQTRLFGGCEIE
jgi:hypothetical protein